MKKNVLLLLIVIGLFGCKHSKEPAKEYHLGHIGQSKLPVYDIRFFSESLQRDMHLNVVLPRDYERSELSYPVLYLAHGYTSNYNEFVNIGVPNYLNQFDMIVVMLDVGNSFYINWAKSHNGNLNYADYVCKDVINYIDSNYRTIAEKKGRAISGISMGGFGALSLGLSHPDLFCSLGSHSGAISYARDEAARLRRRDEIKPNFFLDIMAKDTTMYYLDIDIPGFSTMRDRTPKGTAFLKPEDAERVDPFKLVLEIPKKDLPHIYLDCGNKDGLITSAKDFMTLMLENDIPFQYGFSEGTHEEDYWGREVAMAMAVQYTVMMRHIWGKEFPVYNPYAEIFKNMQPKTSEDKKEE